MKRAIHFVLFVMIVFLCLHGKAFAQWTFENIDSVGTTSYPSIAVDTYNKLHISYTNGNGEFKYATNKTGQWAVASVALGGYKFFAFNDIAVGQNQSVHIVYYDHDNNTQSYVTNKTGVWVTTPIGQYVTNRHNSIAVDSNNKAHISYSDFNLTYATNKSGTWTTNILEDFVNVGWYSSIAIDSGNAVHISHYDSGNGDVKYNTNKTGNWTSEIPDSIGNVGYDCSLALDSDDKTHISYCDKTNGKVKYATNKSGIWSTTDVESISCEFTSIAVDALDNVHIAYYRNGVGNDNLRYATNASGVWQTSIVKSVLRIFTVNVGDSHLSLGVDSNNNVYLVYPNYATEQLELATHMAPPPPPSVPRPPSSLLASPSSTSSITLTWKDRSYNEQGFKIERKDGDCNSTNPWTEITTVISNTTSFVDTGLTTETTYAYQVRAYNEVGDSEHSSCSSATTYGPVPPPNPPSSLFASAVSSSSISIRWTDNSTDEQGFKVERKDGDCDSANPWAEIMTVTQNTTNFINTGLVAETTYAYRVRAYKELGNSEYSACSSVTTYATPSEPVTEGTLGTKLNIAGSGFGSKKGKVLIGDAKTSITTWTGTNITAVVKKALPTDSYPVYVVSQSSNITLPTTFTVMDPSISSVVDDHGSPSAPITIYGRYFGTKKGKVYFEYSDGSKTKKKSCKVTYWHMDELTGASEITFLVPKTSKSFLANTYTLKVANKVGTASTTFTVD